jgi:hypothetical protein
MTKALGWRKRGYGKHEYYRDEKLLELAHGEPCLLQVAQNCLGREGSTTVACHSNLLIHGKGRSIKADDHHSVWGCSRCHQWLDSSYDADYNTKNLAFQEAYKRQLHAWLDLADNITIKPWRREAARRVLTHLGVPYGQ